MADEQHTPTVEARGLSRFFGRAVALEGVSFSASPGEALFCLGGNGAGKSTLLSIVAGMLAPTTGELSLFGNSARRRSNAVRAAIGYAGAQAQLYKDFSIEESLLFFAAAYGVPSRQRRVDELLAELGLGSHRKKRVKECSQGVIRKAALARSLLHSPKLLLLDEPFTNLDAHAKTDLLAVLRRTKQAGATLIVASHEEELVRALADRALLLQEGRVVQTLPKASLAHFSFHASGEPPTC